MSVPFINSDEYIRQIYTNYFIYIRKLCIKVTYALLFLIRPTSTPSVSVDKMYIYKKKLVCKFFFSALFALLFSCNQAPIDVKHEVHDVVDDLKDVIDYPDQDARYIGGISRLQEFIADEVNYPQEAIEMNIQGKVFVIFVVEKDGRLSNVSIDRGVHPLLDQEAIRLIKKMPRWKPGKMGKLPVRTRCRLPINFTLD